MATKYTTSYHLDYKSRLKAIKLLPMSLWLEVLDVLLLIKLMLDPPSGFNLEKNITFISSSIDICTVSGMCVLKLHKCSAR